MNVQMIFLGRIVDIHEETRKYDHDKAKKQNEEARQREQNKGTVQKLEAQKATALEELASKSSFARLLVES